MRGVTPPFLLLRSDKRATCRRTGTSGLGQVSYRGRHPLPALGWRRLDTWGAMQALRRCM